MTVGGGAKSSHHLGPNGVVILTGGLARIGTGVYPSRYAGASLLYGYLTAAGASGIFGSLAGGPGRRYDDVAILTVATVGFALGIDTVEGAKHLRRAEAGPLVGIGVIPELRTFRPRLAALADRSDPLALQRRFAAGLLAADPPTSHVYFVDDHFVPYTGARPVAKGYNTKRRLAEPGRADTPIIDERGRAVVFTSGEPSGLTRSLPAALAELRAVLGPDAPILLGFDRGGAFPATFAACRTAGVDWVTYRRGPLAPHTQAPSRSQTLRAGKRIMLQLADEICHDQGLRPSPATHLVRERHPGAAGPDQRPDLHGCGAGVLATGPLADRERLQIRQRTQRPGRDRGLPDGHRPGPAQSRQPST